jgi:hypothetical protein
LALDSIAVILTHGVATEEFETKCWNLKQPVDLQEWFAWLF